MNAQALIGESPPFRDRRHAGRVLASRLTRRYGGRRGVVVLALPRGGAPVGYEVARALHAPLDVFIARKLGVPGHEELAMGALASGGARVINEEIVRALDIPPGLVEEVAAREQREIERREREYRGGYAPLDVAGSDVLLVDDGLATGATMRAAVQALRRKQPARLVVAVPIAAPQTCDEFRREVDEIVCALTPEPFYGVGLWYEDFSQTSDEEVRELLRLARELYAEDEGLGEAA